MSAHDFRRQQRLKPSEDGEHDASRQDARHRESEGLNEPRDETLQPQSQARLVARRVIVEIESLPFFAGIVFFRQLLPELRNTLPEFCQATGREG